MPAPLKAIITRDRAKVILNKGPWRITIAAADLPRWTDLYRSLRDRNARTDAKGRNIEPGPYHQFYAADVAAMEATLAKMANTREGRE